jgi:hypothetical protein
MNFRSAVSAAPGPNGEWCWVAKRAVGISTVGDAISGQVVNELSP